MVQKSGVEKYFPAAPLLHRKVPRTSLCNKKALRAGCAQMRRGSMCTVQTAFLQSDGGIYAN